MWLLPWVLRSLQSGNLLGGVECDSPESCGGTMFIQRLYGISGVSHSPYRTPTMCFCGNGGLGREPAFRTVRTGNGIAMRENWILRGMVNPEVFPNLTSALSLGLDMHCSVPPVKGGPCHRTRIWVGSISSGRTPRLSEFIFLRVTHPLCLQLRNVGRAYQNQTVANRGHLLLCFGDKVYITFIVH